ncbi:MAG: hypothetical protein RLZZ579_392 [Actinomycetota bacterium]
MKQLRKLWFERITSPTRIKLYAYLSLVTQILIVVTGGAVRLTASGLGCPTWPKCPDESLVTTPEMGFHGIIEFGNRLLTFVLLVVALLTFLVAARIHPKTKEMVRPMLVFFGGVIVLVAGLALASNFGIDLTAIVLFAISILLMAFGTVVFLRTVRSEGPKFVVPAFLLGFGIIFQAVLGGITVLTQLNPWIVGAHFLVSALLIASASVLVWRVKNLPKQEVASITFALRYPIVFTAVVAIVVGVLVTGAGPHAGDLDTVRNGLDLEVWQHYHSYPAYLMTALIGISFLAQLRVTRSIWKTAVQKSLTTLFLVSILQAIVGILQARMGVPALLVGIHMLGAGLLTSIVTFQFLATSRAKK